MQQCQRLEHIVLRSEAVVIEVAGADVGGAVRRLDCGDEGPPQHRRDARQAADELRPLAGAVADDVQLHAERQVVVSEPLHERLVRHDLVARVTRHSDAGTAAAGASADAGSTTVATSRG